MAATRISRRVILRRKGLSVKDRLILGTICFVVGLASGELRGFINNFNASHRRSLPQVKRSNYKSAMYMSFVFPSVKRRTATGVAPRRYSRCTNLRMIQVVAIRKGRTRASNALRNIQAFSRSAFSKNNGQVRFYLLQFARVHARDLTTGRKLCPISTVANCLAQRVSTTVVKVVMAIVGLT